MASHNFRILAKSEVTGFEDEAATLIFKIEVAMGRMEEAPAQAEPDIT